MQQTWKINGQVYNHGQLMEMRKQGLDPRKDKIEMKFITKPKSEEKVEPGELKTPAVKPKKASKAVKEVAEKAEETKADQEEVAEAKAENTGVAVEPEVQMSEEEEFEKLKAEKAWVNPEKAARYSELRAKFIK